jgi:hypothetical protein
MLCSAILFWKGLHEQGRDQAQFKGDDKKEEKKKKSCVQGEKLI